MARPKTPTLYMLISDDKYELPLFVADSLTELSSACGISLNTIYGTMRRAKKNGAWCRFVKVDASEPKGEIIEC